MLVQADGRGHAGVHERDRAACVNTAESAVLIRNLLLAQHDGNATIVLAGPATGLVRLLGAVSVGAADRRQVQAAGRRRGLVSGRTGRSRRSRATSPRRGSCLPSGRRRSSRSAPKSARRCRIPGASIEKDFAWSPAHPVVDAYRAFKPMPYDAPASALAAMLYAVHPEDGLLQAVGAGHDQRAGRRADAVHARGGRQAPIPDRGSGAERPRPRACTPRWCRRSRRRDLAAGGADRSRSRPCRTCPTMPRGDARETFSVVIGAASAALIPTVQHQVVGAGAAAPRQTAAARGRRAVPPGRSGDARARRRTLAPPTPAAFTAATKSLFDDTCSECHNRPTRRRPRHQPAISRSNRSPTDRDQWELILAKLKTREMPPDERRAASDEQIDALVKFLETEFARADAGDEAGSGPRHRAPAESRRIHQHDPRPARDRVPRRQELSDRRLGRRLRQHRRRADGVAGADGEVPRPPPGASPRGRWPPSRCRSRSRWSTACASRTCAGSIRATSRRRIASISTPTTSSRSACPASARRTPRRSRSACGSTASWRTPRTVETKPSGLVYFNPYSEERIRVPMPEGDHTLRLGFIDDPFVKTLAKEDIYKDQINKWIGSVDHHRAVRPTGEKPSRKKVLVCDPATGPRCVDRIIATLARRAYRRPVTGAEVAALQEVRGAWPGRGAVGRAGDRRSPSRRCWCRRTSCSTSSAICTRPIRPGSTASPTSSWPRG